MASERANDAGPAVSNDYSFVGYKSMLSHVKESFFRCLAEYVNTLKVPAGNTADVPLNMALPLKSTLKSLIVMSEELALFSGK